MTVASELLRLFVVEAVGRARKEAALAAGAATGGSSAAAAAAGADDDDGTAPEGTPPLGRLLTSADIANIVPQLLLDLS